MKTQLFIASLAVATALVGCSKRDTASSSTSAYRSNNSGTTLGNADGRVADNDGTAHGHDGDLDAVEPVGVGTDGAVPEERARAAEEHQGPASAGDQYDRSAAVDSVVLGSMIAHRQQGLELAKLGESRAQQPLLRQIASSLRVAEQEALDLLRDQRSAQIGLASDSNNNPSGGFADWPTAEAARAAEVSEAGTGDDLVRRDHDFTQPDPSAPQARLTDDDFFGGTTRSAEQAPVRGSVGAQNDIGVPGVDFSALRAASGADFDREFADAALAHHRAGQSLARNTAPLPALSDTLAMERQAITRLQSWRGQQQR